MIVQLLCCCFRFPSPFRTAGQARFPRKFITGPRTKLSAVERTLALWKDRPLPSSFFSIRSCQGGPQRALPSLRIEVKHEIYFFFPGNIYLGKNPLTKIGKSLFQMLILSQRFGQNFLLGKSPDFRAHSPRPTACGGENRPFRVLSDFVALIKLPD